MKRVKAGHIDTEYYNSVHSWEFKNDLFIEFGVKDNPMSDKCYSLAYEYGHSSGYNEIYNYFCDLVDLIK